jgi:hypothetical protein
VTTTTSGELTPDKPAPGRPFEELRSTGLLWLINRVVFHPRGYALALHRVDGQITGWSLLGDGCEVWRFDNNEDKEFAAVEELFRATTDAALRRADAAARPPSTRSRQITPPGQR